MVILVEFSPIICFPNWIWITLLSWPVGPSYKHVIDGILVGRGLRVEQLYKIRGLFKNLLSLLRYTLARKKPQQQLTVWKRTLADAESLLWFLGKFCDAKLLLSLRLRCPGCGLDGRPTRAYCWITHLGLNSHTSPLKFCCWTIL